MASGRFLSVLIAEDERLSKLSMTAEYVYLKTIPHLDRDGMITGRPGLLYSKVCPTREELFGKTQVFIEEWIKVGLVIRFNTEEGPALFFPGFLKHNKLAHYDRERASRFPAPPGYVRTGTGLIREGAEPRPVAGAPGARKKPKTGKGTPPVPPPSNGNQASVQELVQDLGMESVQEPVPILGTEEQEQDQVKDQVKEKAATRAREAPSDETPKAAAAFLPADLSWLSSLWDKNMSGTQTPIIADCLQQMSAAYSRAEIEEAVKIAVKREHRTLDYVQGILKKGAFAEPHPEGSRHRAHKAPGNGASNAHAKSRADSWRSYSAGASAPAVDVDFYPDAASSVPALPGLATTWASCVKEIGPKHPAFPAALEASMLEATDQQRDGKALYRLTVADPRQVEWLKRMGERTIRDSLSYRLKEQIAVDIVAEFATEGAGA